MANANAPIGPEPAARPKAISPMTPVNPSSATKMKYGTRNAAPPNSATRYGNSQMLAMPTALPTHAMMKPVRVAKLSRLRAVFPSVLD